MDLAGAVAVAVVVIGVFLLARTVARFRTAAGDWGWRFGLIHPTVGAAIGVLIFLAIGLFLAWRTAAVLTADHGAAAITGAIIGILLSLASVTLWMYAFWRDYDVPPLLGRVVFGYAIVETIALGLAFPRRGPGLPAPLEAFCLAMVTTTIVAGIPLVAVGWWRGRQHPELRADMSRRAMSLLSGRRPTNRRKTRREP